MKFNSLIANSKRYMTSVGLEWSVSPHTPRKDAYHIVCVKERKLKVLCAILTVSYLHIMVADNDTMTIAININ